MPKSVVSAAATAAALARLQTLLRRLDRSGTCRQRKRARLRVQGALRSLRAAFDRDYPLLDVSLQPIRTQSACQCPLCDQHFRTRKSLGRHFHISHMGGALDYAGGIRCACGKFFEPDHARKGVKRPSKYAALGAHLALVKNAKAHVVLAKLAGDAGGSCVCRHHAGDHDEKGCAVPGCPCRRFRHDAV